MSNKNITIQIPDNTNVTFEVTHLKAPSKYVSAYRPFSKRSVMSQRYAAMVNALTAYIEDVDLVALDCGIELPPLRFIERFVLNSLVFFPLFQRPFNQLVGEDGLAESLEELIEIYSKEDPKLLSKLLSRIETLYRVFHHRLPYKYAAMAVGYVTDRTDKEKYDWIHSLVELTSDFGKK